MKNRLLILLIFAIIFALGIPAGIQTTTAQEPQPSPTPTSSPGDTNEEKKDTAPNENTNVSATEPEPQDTPAGGETIIVPFENGTTGVQTSQSYAGTVDVTVSGTGQASGTSLSDAFYIFTDYFGNPVTPWHPTPPNGFNWTLWINGGPADNFVQPIPSFSENHVYNFQITAPGGPLTFAVGDTFTADNTGAFTVIIGESPKKTLPEKAAELAKTLVGAPYLWEAKGWDFKTHLWVEPSDIVSNYHWSWRDNTVLGKGLDCSGLVWWTYNKAFGSTAFRLFDRDDSALDALWYYEGAAGMFLHNSDPVSESDLKPGDLLFFKINNNNPLDDHVAMYVGPHAEGDVIHATIANDRTVQWDTVSNLKEDPDFTPFNGFGRVKAADVDFSLRIYSPGNLIVTDPDGNTITADTQIITLEETLREVANTLYYSEYDIDGDGELDAEVYSPDLKVGDYLIKVVPKPDALPTDTYSLELEAAETTLTLAQDVLIRDIPSLGYGVRSTGSEITQFVPVAIDIKPGSDPNCFNNDGHGVIPVAILTTDTFDAATVDSFSVTLNGMSVRVKGKSGDAGALEDIDNDGDLDLVVQIEDIDGTYDEGTATATVTGNLKEEFGGTAIEGTDSICIVP